MYLDACFTGTSDGGRLVEGSVVYETPAYPEEVTDTMMILTAVKGTQIARWDREAEHGLFTDHLLDALYGGGDSDGDGEVTAGEVKLYLDRYMSAQAWTLHRKTAHPPASGFEVFVTVGERSGMWLSGMVCGWGSLMVTGG